jgi:hypothetical protein
MLADASGPAPTWYSMPRLTVSDVVSTTDTTIATLSLRVPVGSAPIFTTGASFPTMNSALSTGACAYWLSRAPKRSFTPTCAPGPRSDAALHTKTCIVPAAEAASGAEVPTKPTPPSALIVAGDQSPPSLHSTTTLTPSAASGFVSRPRIVTSPGHRVLSASRAMLGGRLLRRRRPVDAVVLKSSRPVLPDSRIDAARVTPVWLFGRSPAVFQKSM